MVRYAFVSNAQVVALLREEGWEPVKASEQRVRLEDRVGFQMPGATMSMQTKKKPGDFVSERSATLSSSIMESLGLNLVGEVRHGR